MSTLSDIQYLRLRARGFDFDAEAAEQAREGRAAFRAELARIQGEHGRANRELEEQTALAFQLSVRGSNLAPAEQRLGEEMKRIVLLEETEKHLVDALATARKGVDEQTKCDQRLFMQLQELKEAVDQIPQNPHRVLLGAGQDLCRAIGKKGSGL